MQSLHDTISKITKAKESVDVARAVELLLCKCEVLSSNSGTSKKNKSYFKRTNQNKKSAFYLYSGFYIFNALSS
jgi:hypothetical protein